jgi:glutamate N-acetyltransferase/amino-acid N-acetyltransferase
MVLVMANGSADNPVLNGQSSQDTSTFKEGLTRVLKDLALQIVADGEGATKTITIRVNGAASDEDAHQIARTVANSNLVKTAFFGEDANWGRILGAMGRAGVVFDPENVSLSFGDVVMFENGLGKGKEIEAKATEVLREKCFTVTIDLHCGSGSAEMYTCDFSLDYVKINADYRS